MFVLTMAPSSPDKLPSILFYHLDSFSYFDCHGTVPEMSASILYESFTVQRFT